MPRLRATESGQVDNIDLPGLKVTHDEDGVYVLHGRGHFIVFQTRQEAFQRKQEIESVSRPFRG